jgi:hypothetical protein
MRPQHASAKKPRRGIVVRILLFAGGFLLAGAGAALAFFVVGVIDATNNDAVAQATSLVAPTAPTATESGATAVTVAWTSHMQPTGVVVQYTATASGSGGQHCTTSGSSCQVSGLSPGTAYTFSIAASLDSWTTTPITSSFTTLGVTTSSLPNATFGASYTTTLAATGGTGADTWSLTSGTLPAGLSLTGNTISGTPTSTTAATGLVFTAKDASGFTVSSAALSITVLQDSTTTTITDSANTVVYGNEASVIFTPHVTTGHGEAVPNGSVITVSINSGAATCTVTIGTNTTCTIASTALMVGGPLQVSASFASTANLMASTGTTAAGLSVTADATTTTVSETPTSVAYGNETAVTFTPRVTASNGEVVPGVDSITVNVGSASCTTTVTAGSCTIANTALSVSASPYSVSATFFTGDPDLTTSTGTAATGLTVNKDTTTTTVSESPTSVVYDTESTVVFTVGVTATHAEAVPGSDSITINAGSASCNATVSAPTCSIANTALAANATPYTVSATFTGTDPNLSTSTGTSATGLTVTQDSTTTTVSESPTSVVYGNESTVTFTAGVTASHSEAVPSGDTITVSVNSGAANCTVTLPATTCTIGQTAVGAGGPYSVVATFNGDTNLATSNKTAATGLTVTKDSTTTTVSESPTSVVYGNESTVTFTAGVTASHSEAVPNGDTIGISVNSGAATCTVTLPATTCTVANTALGVGGPYSVVATFNGDTNLATSNKTAATGLTVTQDSTTTTVSESASTATYGVENASGVKFTVTVAASNGETGPNGDNVTINVGTANCVATLSSGSGTCQIGAIGLPVGSPYAVSATFNADTNFTTSSSTNSVNFAVTPDTSTTTVTSSANPSVDNQGVTFTATVAPGNSGSGTPTGTATFTITGHIGGTVGCTTTNAPTLSSGQATCAVPAGGLSAADSPYTVSVTYGGDTNHSAFSGSLSPTQTVNAFGTATKLVFTTQPDGATSTTTAFPIQPVVTVEDAFGNTVTTAATVTLSKATGSGTLKGCTSAVATVNGTATFSGCTWNTTGNGDSVMATSGSLNATSNTFNITGNASKLVFSTQPGGGANGSAWTTQPAVTVEDSGSNVVTASSASITLGIASQPGTGAALSCTNPGGLIEVASYGVTTSTGCQIVGPAGTTYTLNAAASGFTTITSSQFAVTFGTATKLAFTTSPGGGANGAVWGTQPVVTVQDSGGNTVTSGTNSNASITLAIASGSGALSCTTNPLVATAGVANFAGCKISGTAGSFTLSGTATGLTSGISNSFTITVGGITHVQDAVAGSAGGSGNTVETPTLSNVPTNGNTLILLVGDDGNTSGSKVSSVTGGGVTTWNLVQQVNGSGSPDKGEAEIWYGLITCSPCTSSNEAVTVTMSSNTNVQLANVSEWSGIATSSPVDSSTSAVGTASGTTFTSGPISLSKTGDLIVSDAWLEAGSFGFSSQPAPPSGFTALSETQAGGSLFRGLDAYQIDSSAGSISAGWTENASGGAYATAIAAFEP